MLGFHRALVTVVAAALSVGPALSQNLNSNDLLNLGLQLLQQQQSQQQQQRQQPEQQKPRQAAPASQPRYDRAAVREAQSLLTALGFDPGPIDGDMGRRTANAIRAFEQSIGLPESGQPSQGVLVALRLDADRRRATGTLVQPAQAAGPSFDCSRAGTPAERSICGDATLAALDLALADVFATRTAMLDPAAQQALREEQQGWLQARDSCAGDVACLDTVIRYRLNELTAALAPQGTLTLQGENEGFGTGGSFGATAAPDGFDGEAVPGLGGGVSEPGMVLFSAGAQDAFRDLPGLARELGTELTIAAVRAMPELAEGDRAAFALMAATEPDGLVELLFSEGAASQPQAEMSAARFRETGDPGQIQPLFQRLSPFAQDRVMVAIRTELPALLSEPGAVDLPVQARVFCKIAIMPYDLETRDFPVRDPQTAARQCSALFLGRATPFPIATEGRLPGFPTTLPLGPAEAEAFVARVSPGGYDQNTLERLFIVSFIAEIGPPEARISTQGQGVVLPLREIGSWQLHLASDRSVVVHRFPDAEGVPGELVANDDGTFTFDGRTVLVLGQSGPQGVSGVGPFLDPALSQSVIAEQAYFAAIADDSSSISDPSRALGMLALFPEQDWPGILQASVPDKAAATLSKLAIIKSANRNRQQMMQTIAYSLDLNEFETARVAEALRARLPDLITRKAAQGPISLRIWCPINLGPWDAAAEVFPIYANYCDPGLANAAPDNVRDQHDAAPDGSNLSLPRELPAPAANAEALAMALASPQNTDQREGWMSYDATLTGKGIDVGNGTVYPHFVWTVSGPYRLHRQDSPLATLLDIAVAAPKVVLEGEALLAAKVAGEIPFDPQDETDIAYLAGIAMGETPMPEGLTVLAYGGAVHPDAQTAGTPAAVLPLQQNAANLADLFATPAAQIVRVGWQAANTVDIAEVYALLPAPADAYAVPWPEGVASPYSAAEIRTVLRVSSVGLAETPNAGPVLTLRAEPARARIFLPEAPDDVIEIAIAPAGNAPVRTLPFPRGAWLAAEVAGLAGIETGDFLLDLASQIEGDPFAARDLAAGWLEGAEDAAPDEGRFWIAGTMQLENYDFGTESFAARSVSIRMPRVDGSEEGLFRRLRFQFPEGAMAVRLPPDEARAWQETTGLIGNNAPFRAEVRLAGLADSGGNSFTLRLDLLSLEVLAPDAAVTLIEEGKILWRSAGAAVWAAPPSPDPSASAAAEPASAAPSATEPPLTMSAPVTADVAGLTVGMAAAEFGAAAAALFDGPALALTTPNADAAEPWGTVTGFTDAAMSQTVLAVHPPGRPDGPVIALMRRLSLPSGTGTPEAVRLSLIEKYGPDPFDAQNYALFWGLPTDPTEQIACSPFRAGAGRAPDLVLDPAGQVEVGSAVSQPGIWGSILAWPPSAETSGAIATVDPASYPRCGPVVTAMIREEAGGGIDLVVWSIDMAAVARILADPDFAAPAAEPAKIKL